MEVSKNIETINVVYKNFKKGDFDPICELLAEDFIMIMPGVVDKVRFAGIFKGKRGFKDYCKKVKSTQDIQLLDIVRMVAMENRVDAHIHESWTIKESGNTYTVDTVQSWEFAEDGTLQSVTSYTDTYTVARAFIKG